jgi:hypothetical protein
MRRILALALLFGMSASSANAWCDRDCVAVCKITTAQSRSGTVARCVQQSQCDAYRNGHVKARELAPRERENCFGRRTRKTVIDCSTVCSRVAASRRVADLPRWV